MPRLLTIPQEPVARFRWLSAAFAVLFAYGNVLVYAAYAVPSPAARASAIIAAVLLGTWWLYGYRRGGFPMWGWIVDAVLVYVVTLHSPMPGHAIGFYYAGVQLRALYVSRRELGLLAVAYAIARVGTIVVAPDAQPAYAVATTTAFQVVVLIIIAITLHIFVSTVEHRAVTERALERSEERYRLVASAMRDVVYDWDTATGDVEWTESMQAVFGYSPEAVGNDIAWWLSRVHPDDRDTLQKTARAAIADRSVSVAMVQYRVRRADETYAYASGSMIPRRGRDGRVSRVIGAIRDVTTERRLEEQLRESQKMEAVGKLAGGVAHDFNNLLTVIGGHAFMLGRHIAKDGPEEKHLRGISRASDRAASLTKQLLAFSRRQILTPAVLDLNGIVDDVMLMMHPVLGERIEVATHLDPLLFPVFADAGQIAQVLVNLALNARDAMPAGGTLTITTENFKLDTQPGDSGALTLATGDYVRLTIADSGVGMDAATLARIFDPFFTTKPIGQGTGLGLATVYGIVKQSSGDILAASKPGAGASFSIYLPAVQHEVRVSEPRISPSRGIAADAAPEILLVEDDDGVRDFVQAVLQRAGYRVRPAANGVEALETLETLGGRHDAIDLVLADVMMPQMGGPEFVRQFRQVRSDIAVLFITGYTDDAEMLAEIARSGARLLVKPFTAEELERAVTGMLGVRDGAVSLFE